MMRMAELGKNRWLWWLGLFAAVLLQFNASSQAAAADTPLLHLDSGGHMALIRTLVFTADGQWLVSGSDDKVVRVWNLATGSTERTIRGQIGEGEAGKIYAVALSPDNRLLAVGGHTAMAGEADFPIRLYDFVSGKLVALLHGHAASVLSLDFSADGRRLVSGSVDDTAIVWDVSDHRAVARLAGHGGDVNAVRFSRDGARVFSASDDGEVGMWDAADGRRLARMRGHAGIVIALAVSPRDGTIASGGLDGSIRLWNGEDGRFLGAGGARDAGVMALAFSPDGTRLVSGVGSGASTYTAATWEVATGERIARYDGHDNIVLAAAFAPDGSTVATAGGNNNEIHLWNARSGAMLARLKGVGQAVWSVGFATDGSRIAWGHARQFAEPNDLGPLQLEFRLPDASRVTGEPHKLGDAAGAFIRAVRRLGGLSLTHATSGQSGYYDVVDIRRDGQTIASIRRGDSDGYAHNAYGFTPDAGQIITGGGNGFLSAYGLDGLKVTDFSGHSGDVWAIAVSPDGKLLVSGSDDQTLRVWNAATGENIVSLFAASDGEWVMWTPQGYYVASPGGDAHVGWHVNQGADKAAVFVTAAQLKQHFYRPDVVTAALRLGSARNAAAEAGDDGFSVAELLRHRPPEITAKVIGGGSDSARLNVAIEEADAPALSLELVVNGSLFRTGSLAGLERTDRGYRIEVPLAAGENVIRLTATNAVGRSVKSLSVRGSGKQRRLEKGTFYLLAVGVDDYPNFKQNLAFAGADARSFRDLAIATAGRLHRETRSVLLARDGDGAPTAAAVLAALGELEQAGPDDTVVIFVAGHGVNDGADYLFLPSDATYRSGRWVADTVVSWRRLQEVMERTRGQRILLVDTCHAGNAFNPRLVKDSADGSIALLAATDGETLAQERSDLGHGVFTNAVLEGLKGKADTTADRLIHLMELSDYVAEAVSALTGGKQRPASFVPASADFVIAPL